MGSIWNAAHFLYIIGINRHPLTLVEESVCFSSPFLRQKSIEQKNSQNCRNERTAQDAELCLS